MFEPAEGFVFDVVGMGALAARHLVEGTTGRVLAVFEASFYIETATGLEWVSCPSTYLDNPFIDQERYRAQLEAATATDPELGRSWIEGDWAIARGAFFAGVLSEARSAIDPWPLPEQRPTGSTTKQIENEIDLW